MWNLEKKGTLPCAQHLFTYRGGHIITPSLLSSFTVYQIIRFKGINSVPLTFLRILQRTYIVFFFLCAVKCHWNSLPHPQWSDSSAEQPWVGKLLSGLGSLPTDITQTLQFTAVSLLCFIPDGSELPVSCIWPIYRTTTTDSASGHQLHTTLCVKTTGKEQMRNQTA